MGLRKGVFVSRGGSASTDLMTNRLQNHLVSFELPQLAARVETVDGQVYYYQPGAPVDQRNDRAVLEEVRGLG